MRLCPTQDVIIIQGLIEEKKRIIEELPHKQLILNIGKTKYTVNLHFKQGTWET